MSNAQVQNQELVQKQVLDLCEEFKRKKFIMTSNDILKFVSKELFFEVINSDLIQTKIGKFYIAKIKTDKEDCKCETIDLFKSCRIVKVLGKGTYGEAYHVELPFRINGTRDAVFKKMMLSTAAVPCYTKRGKLLCEDTSELVLHTKIINKLADPENKLFSLSLFQMYDFTVCKDRMLTFTPLFSGTLLDKLAEPLSTTQVCFTLVSVIHALAVIQAHSQTMHNDLKADNIFVEPLRNVIINNGFNPDDYDYVYFKLGAKRWYFLMNMIEFIPLIGDWGLASSYGKNIHNDLIAGNDNLHYTPNFYSPSSDVFFFLYDLSCNNEVEFNNLYKSEFFVNLLGYVFYDKELVCYNYKDNKNHVTKHFKKNAKRIDAGVIAKKDKFLKDLQTGEQKITPRAIFNKFAPSTKGAPGGKYQRALCLGKLK